MRLRELVHAPAVTCLPATTLMEAVRLLHLHEIGSLVVVDELGAIKGIVTDRDIALKGIGQELPASTTVDRVMTRTVVTIGIDADTMEAASRMLAHGVRRLPVVDAKRRLCGIVALDDLVMFVEQEGETLRRALAGQIQQGSAGWAHNWD